MPYPYASDREEILSRLRKIEGQLRGIQRMVSEDAACMDLLTQISAVRSGIDKVGLRVLRDHMRGSVAQAVQTPGDGEAAVEEVVKVVERFIQS